MIGPPDILEVYDMTREEILEEIVRYMVANSEDGVFHGTPRDAMERLSVSSGPLYDGLREMGITRVGRGRNANWHIPANIVERYC